MKIEELITDCLSDIIEDDSYRYAELLKKYHAELTSFLEQLDNNFYLKTEFGFEKIQIMDVFPDDQTLKIVNKKGVVQKVSTELIVQIYVKPILISL